LHFIAFGDVKKIGEQTCLFKTLPSFSNHRLFYKRIEWKLKIPYAILREYKKKFHGAQAAGAYPATGGSGRSGAFQSIKKDQSFVWSNLLNEVRTYFQPREA